MAWTVSPYTIVIFGSAAVALAVGLFALRQRPDQLALPLAVLMFAVAAWAIPDAISLGFSNPERVVFWHRLIYPGVVSAPVIYLVFTIKYAGYERWLSFRSYVFLAAIPFVTVVIVWTNAYHDLYWQSLSIENVNGASVLLAEYGAWYWVNLGYLYLLTILALSILGGMVLRSGTVHRKQAALMFAGGIVPLTTNVIMQFRVGAAPMVDLTTTALTVSGLTFGVAVYHLDLLAVRPVARDWLVDELDDGVVVVGPNGLIRDFNQTAAHILPDIAINRPAEEIIPSKVAPDGGELMVETEDETRRFRTRSTELMDKRGQPIGRILYLNDVTDIVDREQRISVLIRILRHNIRNELNVVHGHLELLENRVSPDYRDSVEIAMERTMRVIESAEKAREVEGTLRNSDKTHVVSAEKIVKQVISDAQKKFPDASIVSKHSQELENEFAVRVVDVDMLEISIWEIVENAVTHSHSDAPEVTIQLSQEDDLITISVADNGPGIPDKEIKIRDYTTETPLEHSNGLGLWLVQWTASLSSGELSFKENTPRGSTVSLKLPSASA